MKELTKPVNLELNYGTVKEFDECTCFGPAVCNKVCGCIERDQSHNNSYDEFYEDEILF